jgi:uncharacterized membrane protein YcaP (DUF421 family)
MKVPDLIFDIFGEGKDLNALQMSARAIVISLLCVVLIRISGRRSFAMRAPFDNMVMILLGAILSRAVTGVSPFVPVVISCTVIAFIHKFLGMLGMYSKVAGRILKAEPLLVFEKGKLLGENMKHCMVTEKDIKEGIRSGLNEDSFENVDRIYIERNGQISIIKKEESK